MFSPVKAAAARSHSARRGRGGDGLSLAVGADEPHGGMHVQPRDRDRFARCVLRRQQQLREKLSRLKVKPRTPRTTSAAMRPAAAGGSANGSKVASLSACRTTARRSNRFVTIKGADGTHAVVLGGSSTAGRRSCRVGECEERARRDGDGRKP